MSRVRLCIAFLVLGAQGVAAAADAPATGAVAPIEDPTSTEWRGTGRTPGEQRFSPLTLINEKNVGRLKLAWHADLHTYRGVEANPLFFDGVIYNVSAWSITTAYEATTGKVLWTFDPKVTPEFSRIACCGPVSRGLAAANGKIIVGALDGRLIGLDAKTGKELWTTQTLTPGQPLAMTGAPRIAGKQVVIGNSGGDLGARGYVSAYDIDTGKQKWKFFIVPGDPAKLPEGAASDSAMAMASKTWNGEWWKVGGGGNAWDGIVYDDKRNLVYFATGNGSPHPQAFRSPSGGDNLFLCSILALDADSGAYKWHFQEVPGEEWDYDCTNTPILATLPIDGRPRDVLMHAPKNGFFYVMDRATGELLSAKGFVPNTWASHIDMKTGKPVLTPEARLTVKPTLLTPGYGGAHNWNPMSFSPLTGYAYIPAQEQYEVASRLPDGEFKFVLGQTTIGAGVRNYPELRKQLSEEAQRREKGYLLAWDVLNQKEAWRVPYSHPGNSGTLVTAGNLVLQGTIHKTFAAYRATDGKKLWEMPIQNVPSASPMTFAYKGKQYIAVNAGWNSAIVANLSTPEKAFSVSEARLLVFSLDGRDKLPPEPPANSIEPPPSAPQAGAAVARGADLYAAHCQICHGQRAVGGVKDLRFLTTERHDQFFQIVLEGKLKAGGMQSFADKLTHDQAADIHSYLINRAQEDWQPDFTRPKRK